MDQREVSNYISGIEAGDKRFLWSLYRRYPSTFAPVPIEVLQSLLAKEVEVEKAEVEAVDQEGQKDLLALVRAATNVLLTYKYVKQLPEEMNSVFADWLKSPELTWSRLEAIAASGPVGELQTEFVLKLAKIACGEAEGVPGSLHRHQFERVWPGEPTQEITHQSEAILVAEKLAATGVLSEDNAETLLALFRHTETWATQEGRKIIAGEVLSASDEFYAWLVDLAQQEGPEFAEALRRNPGIPSKLFYKLSGIKIPAKPTEALESEELLPEDPRLAHLKADFDKGIVAVGRDRSLQLASNVNWPEVVYRLNLPNRLNPAKRNWELALEMRDGGQLFGVDFEGRFLIADRGVGAVPLSETIPAFSSSGDLSKPSRYEVGYQTARTDVYGKDGVNTGYEMFLAGAKHTLEAVRKATGTALMSAPRSGRHDKAYAYADQGPKPVSCVRTPICTVGQQMLFASNGYYPGIGNCRLLKA